jgi:RNA polymerase sigma-70 factor (ECF subfamily)
MERVELEAREERRIAEGAQEASCIERARGGDREAFDALVRAHYERIYACAFRLIGNHEDAEDLAQECFVKAHAALSLFGGRSRLSVWLRSILVHLVRDRLRARDRRPGLASLQDDLQVSATPEPAAELGRKELGVHLGEAMRALPDHLRIPLVLRALEGLDYDEISASTGVTAATARTQVMRARKALRRLLEARLGGHGE